MIHRRSVSSTELLKVGVGVAISAQPVDVTVYPVELAVVEEHMRPEDADYADGAWEMISGTAYATVLLGPNGAIQLAETDEFYVPWVRLTIGSEKPEFKSFNDVIEVY